MMDDRSEACANTSLRLAESIRCCQLLLCEAAALQKESAQIRTRSSQLVERARTSRQVPIPNPWLLLAEPNTLEPEKEPPLTDLIGMVVACLGQKGILAFPWQRRDWPILQPGSAAKQVQ